jgi:hypothetical protein
MSKPVTVIVLYRRSLALESHSEEAPLLGVL